MFDFRLAIETHSTATKKNKEWKNKIITVIIKAEEIMYSKANSEVLFFFQICGSFYFVSTSLDSIFFPSYWVFRLNTPTRKPYGTVLMMPSTRLSVEMRALKQESFCHLVLKVLEISFHVLLW